MKFKNPLFSLAFALTFLFPITYTTSIFAQGGIPQHNSLGAVGIGVSDLQRSSNFYQHILDLKVLRTYELGYINEIVLGRRDAEGAVLVLMNWPNDTTRRYDGTDVKLVYYVADPLAVIEKIRRQGLEIIREATPIEALNGRIVGLARDPDNYVVEVIQQE